MAQAHDMVHFLLARGQWHLIDVFSAHQAAVAYEALFDLLGRGITWGFEEKLWDASFTIPINIYYT